MTLTMGDWSVADRLLQTSGLSIMTMRNEGIDPRMPEEMQPQLVHCWEQVSTREVTRLETGLSHNLTHCEARYGPL
jgi:hypothetical protein